MYTRLRFTALILLPLLAAAQRTVTDVEVTSSDGQKIPAVLSMPEGKGPFPIVVTIHGGMGGREREFIRTLAAPNSISPTVNLLNEQPWAVFSISFRAGGILGREEDDILAGVRHARTLARIDPRRVGVLGGSHGGHLALRAAIRLGREFACVAAGSPWMTNPESFLYGDLTAPPLSEISADARRFIEETRSRLGPNIARNMGVAEGEIRARLAERSIEANAGKIRMPVLFLTGLSDVQVPHTLVAPSIARAKSGGAKVTVYTAAKSRHGFYWGRNIDGGARAGLGAKSPEELAEEEAARQAILRFFRNCFR